MHPCLILENRSRIESPGLPSFENVQNKQLTCASKIPRVPAYNRSLLQTVQCYLSLHSATFR
jgi:hypothetical protein